MARVHLAEALAHHAHDLAAGLLHAAHQTRTAIEVATPVIAEAGASDATTDALRRAATAAGAAAEHAAAVLAEVPRVHAAMAAGLPRREG